MVSGEPALVVRLGARRGGTLAVRRDVGSRSLAAALSTGILGARLPGALLLGEERGDPGVVDEVAGTSEGTGKDEVEEDTASKSQLGWTEESWGASKGLQLRVEDAQRCLDNADGTVIDAKGVESVLAILYNTSQDKTEVLRVQVGGETVGQALRGASRNVQAITGHGQVANNLARADSI